MSASDIERVVLGSIVMNSDLLRTSDLTSSDFETGLNRKVFNEITTMIEDGATGEISLHGLAERFPFEESGRVSGLITGIQKITPEMFAQNVHELRRRRGAHEIGRDISREIALEQKTGTFDPEAWKRIFGRVDDFRRLTEPQDPIYREVLAERGAESVKVRKIPWLWPGVMPTHMATAITGDAGQGKSLVAVDLAARVSSGAAFPVYDKPSYADPGHVFYITSEGVPEMILVPRLMAAGANLSKITIIEGVMKEKGDFSMFDITRNLPNVERRAKDFPDLKLIIIDPIASFLPERINTNQSNQVRQAMDRISELAYKIGIASPVVMHFAKTPGVKAVHKTSGSAQFEAAVKMSWSVIRRDTDPRNVRLLVPQKSNITGAHKSLSFSIHPVDYPTTEDPAEIISTAKITFGELVDENPETLICPPIETDGNVPRAVEFLRIKMKAGGRLNAGELTKEAEREGLPYWSLNKARKKLKLGAAKSNDFKGGWYWYSEQKEKP